MKLGLRQAGSRPNADVAITRTNEARGRDLDRKGRYVGLSDQFLIGVALGNAALDRHKVDEIEDRPKVDREGFLALARENPTCGRTTWDIHVVDELVGIGRVVCDGLVTGVVERLDEGRSAAAGIGHRGARARGSAVGDKGDRILLVFAKVGVERLRDRPDGPERNRKHLAADGHGLASVGLERVGEFELEGQMLLGITSIVDVDLVDRVRVHRIIVRTGARIFARLEIGD